MTAQPAEALAYPSPPWVTLYTPTPTEEERKVLTAANAATNPEESWRNAILAHRIVIINEARKRLAKEPLLDEVVIRGVLDALWRSYFPLFHKVTGPMVAESYIRAFRKAGAGDVPIKMIYALAEEHVRRTGDYFHGTSSDALIQGFNTYVNRQVPKKAALERVIDAYGLTPRQMSGLTSAKAFDTKIETSLPTVIKAKIKRYIGKSISDRLGIFARQESHNLNEQAQQVAWMWLVEHGKLPKNTEKMWVTARDERVCAICGPLHRQKIPVGETFLLEDGQKLYVPGAHVNCRCKVRLLVPLSVEVGKSRIAKADFDPKEHPRGRGGRFVRAGGQREAREAEAPTEELERAVREARELAERERREAIERAAARPPQIEVRGGQIQPAEQIKAKGQIRARGQIQARGEPVEAAAPQMRAMTPQMRARIGGGIAPSVREQIQALFPEQAVAVSAQLGAMLQQAGAEAPTRTTTIRNAVRFVDRNGDPMSVFYVPENYADAVHPEQERVMLTNQDTLMPFDAADASGDVGRAVLNQFNTNIDDKVWDILYEAQNQGIGHVHEDEAFDEETGELRPVEYGSMELAYEGPDPNFANAVFQLDIDDLTEVVSSYAHRDEPWATGSKAVITAEYFAKDSMTFLGSEEIPLHSLWNRGEFALSEDDLEVVMVTMDEGHEEAFDYDPGSRHGEEQWVAPGNYKIVGERKFRDPRAGNVPVRMLRVEPEVEETKLQLPDLGDESQWPPLYRGDFE